MKYLAVVLALCMGCGALTSLDKETLAQREGQEDACIAAHMPDKAAIDACLAQVRAASNAKLNGQFDGGF